MLGCKLSPCVFCNAVIPLHWHQRLPVQSIQIYDRVWASVRNYHILLCVNNIARRYPILIFINSNRENLWRNCMYWTNLIRNLALLIRKHKDLVYNRDGGIGGKCIYFFYQDSYPLNIFYIVTSLRETEPAKSKFYRYCSFVDLRFFVLKSIPIFYTSFGRSSLNKTWWRKWFIQDIDQLWES